MAKEKEHKGRIADWTKYNGIERETGKRGYAIIGRFLDHPYLGKNGGLSQTSPVVAHDEATGEIETRNSRYTLVGSEKVAD